MDGSVVVIFGGILLVCGFTYLLHKWVRRRKWIAFAPSLLALALAVWLIVLTKQSGGDFISLGLVVLAVILLIWGICGVLFGLILVWLTKRKGNP